MNVCLIVGVSAVLIPREYNGHCLTVLRQSHQLYSRRWRCSSGDFTADIIARNRTARNDVATCFIYVVIDKKYTKINKF